jgi:hypothetical protein
MKVNYPEGHIAKFLFRRLRHFPKQPLTYLHNPKVACTSIEAMLWRAYDPEGAPENPHKPGQEKPYPRSLGEVEADYVEDILASEFFSVVRNPYARFLSAYSDKVARASSWENMRRKFGYRADAPSPGLSEFLHILQERDPFAVDQHFRPQHINLLHGFAPLDFLGYLEDMEAVHAYLREKGLTLTREAQQRATNASDKVREMISPKDAELILRYYANDFTIYGYSEDPGVINPHTRAPVDPRRRKLRRMLRQAVGAPEEAEA